MGDIDRNYDRIQLEKYRGVVDGKFNAAHDALTEAYYKHWKQGKSFPWQGYDVQATPAESKTLFDKLHGAIFVEHRLAIDVEHNATAKEDQDAKYSSDGLADAETKKTELAAEGISVNI